MFQAFWRSLLLVCGGELITIEGLSLSALGYLLLPLVTSQLVSNNREFDVCILKEFTHCLWRGAYNH